MINNKIEKKCIVLLIVGLLSLTFFSIPENVVAGTTEDIYVNDDNTGYEDGSSTYPYNTIQEAITASGEENDATIHIDFGEYGIVNINKWNTHLISDNFNETDNDPNNFVTIDANGGSYGVTISKDLCSIESDTDENEIIIIREATNGVDITQQEEGTDAIYVYGTQFIDCDYAIKATNSQYSVFEYNDITNTEFDHDYGIYLDGCSYCEIINNDIDSRNDYGIYMVGVSSSRIYDNDLNYNQVGIKMESTTDCDGGYYKISENYITNSDSNGIELYSSNSNHFTSNNVNNNGEDGIYISGCDDNLFYENQFNTNTEYGMYITGSTNHDTYSNYFLHNNGDDDIQGYDDAARGTNYWDDDSSTGNYWDDYEGPGYYYLDGDSPQYDKYPNQSGS